MMLIMVERALDSKKTDDEYLSEQVATEIRRKILVRCQVEILDYGSLPRTERKSKRVFDHRNNAWFTMKSLSNSSVP
jgi:phenylacetate-CoA ligase